MDLKPITYLVPRRVSSWTASRISGPVRTPGGVTFVTTIRSYGRASGPIWQGLFYGLCMGIVRTWELHRAGRRRAEPAS